MDNDGAYVGDGRTLEQIGDDLGVDAASLVTVIAQTLQQSALKLFRLLYPTVGSRAKCQSIGKIPREQLNDIYSKFSYTLLINKFIFVFQCTFVRYIAI